MYESLYFERNLFVISIIFGICITLFYDIFRCIRLSIKHNNVAVAIEDMIFWATTGILIFYMLYKYNYGGIRAYVFIGMLVGMLGYSYTISKAFIKVISFIMKKIVLLISKLILIFKIPIRAAYSFFRKRLKIAMKTVKIAIKNK